MLDIAENLVYTGRVQICGRSFNVSNIHLLDSNTVNKIAAGEVVERPASVVKELIENSIDAGATRIEIEIHNGGKSLMRITDDGVGMSREDAALSIRRHATSKLSNVLDLQRISTLGFRGEALPTIAAVSKFTLQTRRANDEVGTKIHVDGGKNIDTGDTGCKVGTTVIVEELFFNTPARLKFLKATTTEANKIHDYIIKLALSRPEIAFKLINGNRAVLTTPGNGKLIDVLTSIYGTEISESLLDAALTFDEFKLTGFIGKPNFLKSYRNWQTFIINGRVVNNRTISKAIEESYKSLIPKTGYPLAVLRIDVPQNSIDVNVHPQKTELKFDDEGRIFKAVYRAVREAISEKRPDNPEEYDLKDVAAAPTTPHYESLNLKEYFGKDEPPAQIEDLSPVVDEANVYDTEEFPAQIEPITESKPKQIETPPSEKLQPIGQVALCYIVAQGGNDLYIVDQHAAHERILFDKLCSYADDIPAQGLLIHRVMKFDRREATFIENNLELFAKLGFTMEMSGENEFRLIEVPVDAADTDPEDILREIISSLPDLDASSNVGDKRRGDIAKNIRRQVLATTACKAAVKAGQELNIRQMQIILDDLSRTPHPHTCPHGRPTIIKFTDSDLAKMFKRG